MPFLKSDILETDRKTTHLPFILREEKNILPDYIVNKNKNVS